MEEENKQLVEVENNVPSVVSSEEILNKINSVATIEELQEVANMFNLNITKKEMARALQQDELLDLVLKQAGERLRKRPDEMSTKDLLDYMNAFQSNLERTQNEIDRVKEGPTIQVNNDNKKVIVNINNLSRDSGEAVLDVINDLIKDIGSGQPIDVVDVSSGGEENND